MSKSGFVDDWQSGKSLVDCNLHMLSSEDSYDVTFLVGENEAMVRAHCYVLMSRSCVFHAMLRGPLAEREAVRVPDVPEVIFKDFLRFLYTDSVDVTPDNVTALLYLGKKYAVGSLEKLCLANLESSLFADTACTILEQAHRFDEEHLMSKALDMIVENSEVALKSKEFTELCKICIDKVIQSEDITADPELIFSAALSWASEECKRNGREITPVNKRKVLGDSIFHIGFPSMDAQTFAEVVVPTRILSGDEHTMIFCYLASKDIDVAPFRTREISQGQVLFYKGQVQAPKCTVMRETIRISSDHDVSMKGLLVHRSKYQNIIIGYQFKYCQCCEYTYNFVETGNVSFIDEPCHDEITFQGIVKLKANVQYVFDITTGTGSVTSAAHIVGTRLKTPIKVRYIKENITFDMYHHSGTLGVIAGLVLTDR